MFKYVLPFLLAGCIWQFGILPLRSEIAMKDFKQAVMSGDIPTAHEYVKKAIKYDPDNSLTLMVSAIDLFARYYKRSINTADDLISQVIICNNGDVVPWSAHYLRGLVSFTKGDILGAYKDYQESLYYNPYYGSAQKKKNDLDKMIAGHTKFIIQVRDIIQ